MSYSWFKKGTCSATQGSTRVDFSGADITTAPNKPVVGDAWMVDFSNIYEVTFIGKDQTGEYIVLDRGFEQATVASSRYAMMRLASSNQNAALVAKASAAINQKQISLDNMYEWYTSTADTVDFTGVEGGTVTVSTYHALSMDISTVSGHKSEIIAVANNIASVNEVGSNISQVKSVGDNINAVKNVSDNIDEIKTSNTNKDSISTVANNISSVNTVSSNIDAIEGVNSNESNINNVNSNSANINTVAGDSASINTVAGDSSNITTVASNIASVNTAATNMDAIKAAPAAAQTATDKAAESEASAKRAEASASTFTWKPYCRTEADMWQMIEDHKTKYAASGFVHYGKHFVGGANNHNVNEGLWTSTNNPNILVFGQDTPIRKGTSSVDLPVTHIAGFVSEVLLSTRQPNNDFTSVIKFPEAPDGTVTYDSASGVVVKHADATTAFAAETATNKVVTERVDVFGFEFFLEAVNSTNPYIYPKGCIQSKATTMNGLTTVVTNRPSTYYEVFVGDTSSNGLGVHFFNLTDAQKQAVVSDASNNLFVMSDGTVVQWRCRQCTIAGAGNGDWDNINSQAGIGTDSLRFTPTLQLAPRGHNNSIPNVFRNNVLETYQTDTYSRVQGSSQDTGVFKSPYYNGAPIGDFAVNGLCFFHVWGSVPRLNQGAYHPSFNDRGTRQYGFGGGSGKFWYNTGVAINVVADCFAYGTKVDLGSGDIANGPALVGRPDDRFYDAIYASGQGGVSDDRLSAWDMSSPKEASKNKAKHANGSWRGKQKLIKTSTDGSTSTEELLNLSVEGDFSQIDVFGSLSDINALSALSSGWQGKYGGAISSSSQLTRDAASTTAKVKSWSGSSWSRSTVNISNPVNTVSLSGMVCIVEYMASSHLTELSDPKYVLNADSGLLGVLITESHRKEDGSLLAESCANEILKSNASGIVKESASAIKHLIDGELKRVKTQLSDLVAPTNSSKAVKIAVYQVSINQKLYLGFLANTMEHNGINWGEFEDMQIPTGKSSTFPDANGSTQLATWSISAKPYGYSLNQARAGVQVSGVDL